MNNMGWINWLLGGGIIAVLIMWWLAIFPTI